MLSRLLLLLYFVLISVFVIENVSSSEVLDKDKLNVTKPDKEIPNATPQPKKSSEATKYDGNEDKTRDFSVTTMTAKSKEIFQESTEGPTKSSKPTTQFLEFTRSSTKNLPQSTDIPQTSSKIYPQITEKITINGINHPYNFGILCIILALIIVAIIVFLQITKLKKDSKKMRKQHPRVYIPKPLTPEEIENALNNHIKLTKGEELLDNISKIIEMKDEVRKEFRTLGLVVREETKTMVAEEGRLPIHKVRNRYNDIIPFDSNRVVLENPIGDPHSTYINASPMKFSSIEQTFISAQAPRPNTFGGFWQMILEKKIHTVVMITDLIEGGRRKAEKYWPDEDDFPEIPLENDIKVKYVSDIEQGTYTHRSIMVTDPDTEEEHLINHLQTTSWKDMQAPTDTNVLLDLLYKVEELATAREGPILVHCSAGVGRTGTFIALYKLTQELAKDEVTELDLFMTTLQMRKQRSFMIQKAEQYMYVFKCLHKYLSDREDVKEDVIGIKGGENDSVEPSGDNELQTLEDSTCEKKTMCYENDKYITDIEKGLDNGIQIDVENKIDNGEIEKSLQNGVQTDVENEIDSGNKDKKLENGVQTDVENEIASRDIEKGIENGVDSDVERGVGDDVEKIDLNIMSLQINGDEHCDDKKCFPSHSEDIVLTVE